MAVGTLEEELQSPSGRISVGSLTASGLNEASVVLCLSMDRARCIATWWLSLRKR